MEFEDTKCIEQIVFEICNFGEEHYLYLQEITTMDKIAIALLGDLPDEAPLDVFLTAAREYADSFLDRLSDLEKAASAAAMSALDDPEKEFDTDLPIACQALARQFREEFVIEKFIRIAELAYNR